MIALSIPTDFELLIPWLEEQLVGMNLGRLVRELNAIHRPETRLDLRDIVGENLSEVLADGLGVLPAETVQQLLRNPGVMVQLQEQAFLCGAPHWEQLARRGEAGRRSRAMQSMVLKALKPFGHDTQPNFDQKANPDVPVLSVRSDMAGRSTPEQSAINADADSQQVSVSAMDDSDFSKAGVLLSAPTTTSSNKSHNLSSHGRRWKRTLLSLSTVAALSLMAILALRPAPQQGWGFNSPGALTMSDTEPEFFARLADAAAQWSNKVPENATELDQRLTQFSSGCQTLIDALESEESLPQLSPGSRQWLLGKCRTWKDDIDRMVTQLRAAPNDFESIRSKADGRLTSLIQALRIGPEATA
jgi:hypothetical protein